jgi:DNA modification methylase
MADNSVNCCITSPPYWGLRDYGAAEQMGLEESPELYIQKMVVLFREVRRALKKEGTLWLNIGDSYWNNYGGGSATMTTGNAGAVKARGRHNKPKSDIYKIKDLVGIPWMLAFALRSDGWFLRQDIIWHKTNPMPESVTDRCTKSHEYIFLMSKSDRYYFDQDAIKEKAIWASTVPWGWDTEKGSHGTINYNNSKNHRKCQLKGSFNGKTGIKAFRKTGEFRNKRSVWSVSTKPFKGAHFATFPEKLIVPCVLAGCPMGGVILDPFFGAGTVGLVAKKNGRDYIGIELNPEYVKMAQERIDGILL